MKLTAYLILCMFLFVTSAFAVESGMNPAGEAWVKAFNANDVDAIVALYAEDATVFPPDAMIAKGKAAIREVWAGLLAKFRGSVQLSDTFHETRESLSFAWGRFSMTLTPKEGGEPLQIEGRFSDVSKKINGKWQYIVDHASVPLPPPPPETAPSK